MEKDTCCSQTGLYKWFCPSIIGFVAGIIMIAAGSMKFMAGKAMLTGVGGMAMSVFGISGHGQIALALGLFVATVEVVGGISFAVGCRKTSKWAALFLSAIMGVAILFKLTHLKPLSGNLLAQAAGLLEQIRLDLLLFAVFFQKALKLIKNWCGMGCCGTACCTEMPKKK